MNKVRRFFSDTQGNIAVIHAPNPPLLVWIVAELLGFFLYGKLKSFAHIVAVAAILIWAWLEVYSGRSPFRRVLGGIVLVLSIVSIIRKL